MEYKAPQIEDLGDIADMTAQFDKVGTTADGMGVPNLDSSVIPPPFNSILPGPP